MLRSHQTTNPKLKTLQKAFRAEFRTQNSEFIIQNYSMLIKNDLLKPILLMSVNHDEINAFGIIAHINAVTKPV